jgi:hypothetical protein
MILSGSTLAAVSQGSSVINAVKASRLHRNGNKVERSQISAVCGGEGSS